MEWFDVKLNRFLSSLFREFLKKQSIDSALRIDSPQRSEERFFGSGLLSLPSPVGPRE